MFTSCALFTVPGLTGHMAECLTGSLARLILRGDGDPKSQVRRKILLRGEPPRHAVILDARVSLIHNDPGSVRDHHVHGRSTDLLFLRTNADELPGAFGVAGQIHFRDHR